MSGGATSKAWIVAATIGAVEALKDQGICRWNYTIRSLHQHVKNNIRSFAQANTKRLSPCNSSSSVAASNQLGKKSEERMRKVMELSCLGPNTVRF